MQVMTLNQNNIAYLEFNNIWYQPILFPQRYKIYKSTNEFSWREFVSFVSLQVESSTTVRSSSRYCFDCQDIFQYFHFSNN